LERKVALLKYIQYRTVLLQYSSVCQSVYSCNRKWVKKKKRKKEEEEEEEAQLKSSERA
jgi:hypothetical protein